MTRVLEETVSEGVEMRRSYRVEGVVQGVGFRMWTRSEARALGLRGWVKNLPDGAVEVHAGGEAESVEALEARLASGPPAARVSEVRRTGEVAGLPAEGFEIRY